MSDSIDGEVDYKESYLKCLEQRDVARRDYEVMYKFLLAAEVEIEKLKKRIQYIEPVYYLALKVAEWDWIGIFIECESSNGKTDLLALCKSLEGH